MGAGGCPLKGWAEAFEDDAYLPYSVVAATAFSDQLVKRANQVFQGFGADPIEGCQFFHGVGFDQFLMRNVHHKQTSVLIVYQG